MQTTQHPSPSYPHIWAAWLFTKVNEVCKSLRWPETQNWTYHIHLHDDDHWKRDTGNLDLVGVSAGFGSVCALLAAQLGHQVVAHVEQSKPSAGLQGFSLTACSICAKALVAAGSNVPSWGDLREKEENQGGHHQQRSSGDSMTPHGSLVGVVVSHR